MIADNADLSIHKYTLFIPEYKLLRQRKNIFEKKLYFCLFLQLMYYICSEIINKKSKMKSLYNTYFFFFYYFYFSNKVKREFVCVR